MHFQIVRSVMKILFWTQEQDACADAEDRASQLAKEKEKLEDQVKVRRNEIFLSILFLFYCQLQFLDGLFSLKHSQAWKR